MITKNIAGQIKGHYYRSKITKNDPKIIKNAGYNPA